MPLGALLTTVGKTTMTDSFIHSFIHPFFTLR